jgi:hypothetical protein
MIPAMKPEQFRAALVQLGYPDSIQLGKGGSSRGSMAVVNRIANRLGVSPRQVYRYLSGDSPVPQSVANHVETLLELERLKQGKAEVYREVSYEIEFGGRERR